jgi:hypothetical protein
LDEQKTRPNGRVFCWRERMNELTDENDYDHDYDYDLRAHGIAAM